MITEKIYELIYDGNLGYIRVYREGDNGFYELPRSESVRADYFSSGTDPDGKCRSKRISGRNPRRDVSTLGYGRESGNAGGDGG